MPLIVIGEGEGGVITDWDDDFRQVMHQVDNFVCVIDEHQLDLDWNEICDRVPHLKNRPWGISKDLPLEGLSVGSRRHDGLFIASFDKKLKLPPNPLDPTDQMTADEIAKIVEAAKQLRAAAQANKLLNI